MSSDSDVGPLKTTIAVLASLRFVGPDVDPSLVTAKLGIPPTRAVKRGQPVKSHPDHHHRYGAWILDSELPETCTVAEHIKHLLDRIHDREEEFRWLSSHGYPGDFVCSYWLTYGPEAEMIESFSDAAPRSKGIQLESQLLSRIVALDLDVIVDVAALDGEESVEEAAHLTGNSPAL